MRKPSANVVGVLLLAILTVIAPIGDLNSDRASGLSFKTDDTDEIGVIVPVVLAADSNPFEPSWRVIRFSYPHELLMSQQRKRIPSTQRRAPPVL
jgi:hypothetical protein